MADMRSVGAALLLALALGSPPTLSGMLPHQRLVKDLLDNYDLKVRPVANNSEPISVTHRMNLYQLLDVNEPTQNVKLYVWVTQYWEDVFLGWDPKEYDGITSIVLPYDTVWIPDTYLYNSIEMTRETTERWISITYTTNTTRGPNKRPSASAVFMYPAIYSFSCKMDILYFPFDKQKCTLTYSSWTYDSAGIDYFAHRDHVTFESFVPNEEWKVLSFNYERESLKYACCPYPWTLLHVHLVIQRKPLYYISNLVIPTVIIALIAMVGFFMPASTTGEREQRVDLGINTLLAMSILLLMVSDEMPTTSDFIPIMGWFFLSIIILISVGTFMSSVVIVIHSKGQQGKRVPPCLRHVFFGCLAKILRTTPPLGLLSDKDLDTKLSASVDDPHGDEAPLVTIFRSLGQNGCQLRRGGSTRAHRERSRSPRGSVYGGDFGMRPPSPGGYPHLSPGDPKGPPRLVLSESNTRQLDDIQKNLEEMRSFILERHVGSQAVLEWEYLATVLDRFLLILFTCGVCSVTISMILVGMFKNQHI